jgi:hypothetical protein
MITDEFYLTIMSNSSFQDFPENKTSSFTAKLPRTIEFDGKYEMCLCEIAYPNTIENISQNSRRIIFEINEKRFDGVILTHTNEYSIEVGYYNSIEEIISALNETLNKEIFVLEPEDKFLEYNKQKNRVIVSEKLFQTIGKGYADDRNLSIEDFKLQNVYLENRLALQLGFVPNECIIKNPARLPPNKTFGYSDTIMIYIDLLEPQIVGDIHAQVLKVMPTVKENHRFGEICTRIYTDRTYYPVYKTRFDSISVDIRDSAGGELVPFSFGSLYLLVHFRRIKI